MPKRLVVCCDGTWSTPDDDAPTNVTKLALAVAPEDSHGTEQLVFYTEGVGTRRRERLRGGAFGFGLSRNVLDAYRFLAVSFEPGDELFFVGFSRGAFTARSTVGLVRNSGILRRDHLGDRLEDAYALYRDPRPTTHPTSIKAELFRRSYSHETRVRFIGVWDTVGELGIPTIGVPLLDRVNRRWAFHDTKLSRTVDAAFQALAIDEARRPFGPTLWEPQPDAGDQQVAQVWFAGVHSDVGGGYREAELSEIPLLWMVERAKACGLAFRADSFAPLPAGGDPLNLRRTGAYVAPDPRGPIHDSRTGFYRRLEPLARVLGEKDPGHEYAAASADERLRDEALGYAPPSLDRYLRAGGRIWRP